jgi:hypothetical protein
MRRGLVQPKSSRSRQVSAQKPKPIVRDAPHIQKVLSRAREFMRTSANCLTDREKSARVAGRTSASPKAEPSGQFLPGVQLIPLHDLAARWDVTPEMVREATNTRLFKIVVVGNGWIDHWYLDKSLWPHGSVRFTVAGHGIIHTLIDPSIPGLLFPPTLPLFFPIDEMTRVQKKKLLHTAGKLLA